MVWKGHQLVSKMSINYYQRNSLKIKSIKFSITAAHKKRQKSFNLVFASDDLHEI